MDQRSERIARRFDIPMLVAAALVIPTIIIEEAGPGEPLQTLGVVLNYGIWTAFLTEMVVMIYVVPDRRLWLRKHPIEIVVVLLTPPFFITALQAVRLLRLLRLVRLLRLAPLVRRLFTGQGLKYTTLLAFLTALAGGAAFHQAENGKSFWDGLYWSITTMTTVGYGDVTPQTTAGRIIAVIVMLVGIGFVALLTGAIAQAFISPKIDRDLGEIGRAPSDDQLLTQIRKLRTEMHKLELVIEGRLESAREESPDNFARISDEVSGNY
jgi:voltage-gated potassium channel